MASGRPVVATRVGSLPEVVTEDSGIVIEPGSSDALVEALLRLTRHEELRKRLGRQATARAVDQFSLERMVGSTVDLYAGACG
jgi:glycosyltransferase involved in cell wall biosynthesis